MTTATIDPNDTIPVISIAITQAQLGEYTIALWDQNDRNPSVIATDAGDDIRDEFRIVSTRDKLARLNNYTISWVAFIKALRRGQGARYRIQVRLRQGDSVLYDYEDKGPMNAAALAFDDDIKINLA